MKLSSLQENLKNGLYLVSHIAGKNVNLPILNNIKIETFNNHIKLTTTDLEIGITTKIRGKIEKEGAFTVESKLITDFISLLPNKKIDIENKENKLFIKSDNYKTIIKGQIADDFPLIPEVSKDHYYKTKIDSFKKSLSQVIFAVSNSESRAELSGVFFNFTKDKLIMAATDSYRLAEKEIKINSNSNEEKKIIIPAKTLQELIRVLGAIKDEELSADGGEIVFYVTDNQILFVVGNTEIVSRLIEGQYPDYKQIIPVNNETMAIIERAEFIRAVKATALFSKTGINDINLDFPLGKKKIIITSTSSQTGENTTDLDADVNGKDNGIVVNYRYLLDGINNIDTDNIKFEIINSNTPCILRPYNEEKSPNDYLYIIMPIKQ